MTQPEPAPEPLPIWFFVGLILVVFGLLVTVGAATTPNPGTVLAELRAGIWWGLIMTVAGGAFLAIGLRGRSRSSHKDGSP